MGFERFDVDVAGLVARRLGEQGIDHANHRRAVLSVEQVGDFRHVLHQSIKVDFVFRRAHHRCRTAGVGIGSGEQAIEFVIAHALNRGRAKLTPRLADRPARRRRAHGQHAIAQQNPLRLGPGVRQHTHLMPSPIPVGAAEGCDLLIFGRLDPSKSKIKRSQPSAAPTGPFSRSRGDGGVIGWAPL
ncbi:hypothetical protein D3C72_618740 [compost metagenome]